ncbi:MAG: hypothetical protein E7273_12425 [Pseudobutyrivibrio ruminis]|nr:hypothetical protein [Pseudobutyrivibrio ruminis]
MKNKLSYGLYKHDDILEITPLTENHTITLQGNDAIQDFIGNLLDCYITGNGSQSPQMQEASLDGALVNKFLQQEQIPSQ